MGDTEITTQVPTLIRGQTITLFNRQSGTQGGSRVPPASSRTLTFLIAGSGKGPEQVWGDQDNSGVLQELGHGD